MEHGRLVNLKNAPKFISPDIGRAFFNEYLRPYLTEIAIGGRKFFDTLEMNALIDKMRETNGRSGQEKGVICRPEQSKDGKPKDSTSLEEKVVSISKSRETSSGSKLDEVLEQMTQTKQRSS